MPLIDVLQTLAALLVSAFILLWGFPAFTGPGKKLKARMRPVIQYLNLDHRWSMYCGFTWDYFIRPFAVVEFEDGERREVHETDYEAVKFLVNVRDLKARQMDYCRHLAAAESKNGERKVRKVTLVHHVYKSAAVPLTRLGWFAPAAAAGPVKTVETVSLEIDGKFK